MLGVLDRRWWAISSRVIVWSSCAVHGPRRRRPGLHRAEARETARLAERGNQPEPKLIALSWRLNAARVSSSAPSRSGAGGDSAGRVSGVGVDRVLVDPDECASARRARAPARMSSVRRHGSDPTGVIRRSMAYCGPQLLAAGEGPPGARRPSLVTRAVTGGFHAWLLAPVRGRVRSMRPIAPSHFTPRGPRDASGIDRLRNLLRPRCAGPSRDPLRVDDGDGQRGMYASRTVQEPARAATRSRRRATPSR